MRGTPRQCVILISIFRDAVTQSICSGQGGAPKGGVINVEVQKAAFIPDPESLINLNRAQ